MKKSKGFAHNLQMTKTYILMLLFLMTAFMTCLPQEATAAWSKRVIDGGLVKDTSIKVDINGYVHMSFVKGGCLIYFNNKSGKWVKTIIDSSGQVGVYISMAVDGSGKVHVSYYDETNTALRYATNATGAWVKTTVDNSGDVGKCASIAVDSSGKVYVSYFDFINTALKYATNATGTWVKKTVDNSADVGWDTSIAVDSG